MLFVNPKTLFMKSIWFSRVNDEFGWLGNMAPYSIVFNGKTWRTSEALFQALRFEDESIREIIRSEKSPMGAKMKAKKLRNKMVVIPMSEQDVDNMKKCVRLKFDQNLNLRNELKRTGNALIFEDIGKRTGERHQFWGAKKVNEDEGCGFNMMGQILMELRNTYLIQDS